VGTITKNTKRVPLVLAGIGNVGKAFYGLVLEKHGHIQKLYGLDLRFKAVLKSDGSTSPCRRSRSKASLSSRRSFWKGQSEMERPLS